MAVNVYKWCSERQLSTAEKNVSDGDGFYWYVLVDMTVETVQRISKESLNILIWSKPFVLLLPPSKDALE